ncbi:hypothetical protein SETIT_2G069200v2 [Setaria italica]|uniref:Subtilisin-like protease n=1 Tax=Setaria italica TaxID=4555 RepID=A0A368PW94_SETIT|nr:hypothetical protein SETIT_2G069200v2 [Setaria italica]
MGWLRDRLLLVALFAASLSCAPQTGDGDGAQVIEATPHETIMLVMTDEQVYVVFLGHLPESGSLEYGGPSAVEAAHHDLLSQVLDDGRKHHKAKPMVLPLAALILHSYKRSLNGFAARLTEQEAQKLSSMEGIVSVFPSRTHELLTTRSWDFLGLPQTPPEAMPLEGEVIVGMLDCSVKIIGARMYGIGPNNSTGLSLLDKGGHRSHTTSIVAGRVVGEVCHGRGCRDVDVLAAFDNTITDGVEVISFSVGNAVPLQYFEDAGAIGSFHAMRRGVLTSATDSNSGLDGGHVCNVAPWMLSFAASGIDPRFVDKIILGNGKTIVNGLNTFPMLQNAPLVFPINGTCEPDGLAGGSYEGKIVLCPADNSGDPNDGAGPFMAGADGAVIVGHYPNLSQAVVLPALVAPISASFSSPGPNLITPGILKEPNSLQRSQSSPLHPGLDIIASWTPLSSPTGEPVDNRKVLYNIESGTSMAWTHASGAAAYVKSHRRDWSPAMIISALITTATPMNTPGNAGSNELKYGAGQLNPSKAPDPGLVYDASERDYVAMLCAQGYNATQLALNFSVGFARTVTNVGASPGAVYVAKVVLHGARSNLAVGVSPDRLEFSKQKRTASFGVSISGEALAADEVVSAAVVWCDGEHEVRSPVVVYTVSAGVHHF